MKRNKETSYFKTTFITLAAVLLICVAAYAAISAYLAYIEPQKSNISKEEYFEFNEIDFFPTEASLQPGDSISINTALSSNSSIPMYVLMKLEMPILGNAPLYTFTPGDGWSLLNDYHEGETDILIYGCAEPLEPGGTTTPLTDQLQMVDMDRTSYGMLEDINVTISAYGLGTEAASIEEAYSTLIQERGDL